MNIFVAFFVLLLLLAESTPSAVKSFPLIGVYFCLNMIMITLSTFLATLVIHLYFRGDRNGSVPPLLRRIVIEGIGRMTLVRQRVPLPELKKTKATKTRKKIHNPELPANKFTIGDQTYRPNERNGFFGGTQFSPTTQPMYGEQFVGNIGMNWFGGNQIRPGHFYPGHFDSYPLGSSIERPAQLLGQTETNAHLSASLKLAHNIQADAKPLPRNDVGDMNEPEDSPEMLNSTTTLERDVRELKKYVKTLVNRQKEAARKGLVSMEWRTLAIVLDRLFFFLYLTTIAIAAIVLVPRLADTEVPPAFRDDE